LLKKAGINDKWATSASFGRPKVPMLQKEQVFRAVKGRVWQKKAEASKASALHPLGV
jgi:hypothetical protein